MARTHAVAAIVAVGLVMPGSVGAQANADVATGCLTRAGRIVKVGVGDQPARPCGKRETEITLRLDDGERDPALVPFFLTMDRDGPEQTIATNGPLEIIAQCFAEPIGETLNIRIFVTSEVDGWRTSDGGSDERDAGDEIGMFRENVPLEGERYRKGTLVADVTTVISAVAPDGSYIAIEPDTLGVGLNILGHDCIAVGTAILNQGVLE